MSENANETLRLFSGTHSIALGQRVAEELGADLHADVQVPVTQFANGEVRCVLPESVRGDDVFVIQSHARFVGAPGPDGQRHSSSPNDAILEQATIIDAARLASARRVTAIAPYIGYGRQDRKTGREPITGRLVYDIFAAAGADRIITLDLHSPQAEGFFRGPVDPLTARPVFVDYLQRTYGDQKYVMVSPDLGRVKVLDHYVEQLGDNVSLTIVNKKREAGGNDAETQHLIGAEVMDKDCVIVDDMIDGAGTICSAARTLHENGAKSIVAIATHALFSPPAAERLAASPIDNIVITDTVALPASFELQRPNIMVVSVAKLIASAIREVHHGGSISALFGGRSRT